MVKGNIWQIAVLALALALVLPAVNVAYGDAAAEYDATETTAIDYTQDYTLGNDSAFSYPSLSITSNGTALEEGPDYEFNETSATIDWLQSADTTTGEDATIDYTYAEHSEQTENNGKILQTAGVWVGYLLMITVLGALLVMVFGGGGY